jgi:hypothetical protein
LGITTNILLTQNIPRLPAGARLPTVFLSSWRKRSISRGSLSSFFLERRKKDAEKKIGLKFTPNIRLKQIKI